MNNRILVEINRCDDASTGSIANDVLDKCQKEGYKCFFVTYKNAFCYPYSVQLNISDFSYKFNRIFSKIDGSDGFHNRCSTKRLIGFLRSVHPSIVHIHILHGQYMNIPELFRFLRESDCKVVWTFHDCWALTGRCAHFDSLNCDGWKTGCKTCAYVHKYPDSLIFHRTAHFFEEKMRFFTSLRGRLTIVAPSNWMKEQVRCSFLSEFPCEVIYNGIDMPDEVAKEEKNLFLSTQHLAGKKIFFSAAFPFSLTKGIQYISDLADDLDPRQYAFVVAGLTQNEETKYSKNLISLGKINGKDEMNLLYSVATAFLNPTLEETFSLVNLESLSNGTPVICFRTGGAPETVDNHTGIVVDKGNFLELKGAVLKISKTNTISQSCLERAEKFSKQKMVDQYFRLFESLLA